MTNRKQPFGYKIRRGKPVIYETEADIVRNISIRGSMTEKRMNAGRNERKTATFAKRTAGIMPHIRRISEQKNVRTMQRIRA